MRLPIHADRVADPWTPESVLLPNSTAAISHVELKTTELLDKSFQVPNAECYHKRNRFFTPLLVADRAGPRRQCLLQKAIEAVVCAIVDLLFPH
jgi:hypothetical protein